MRFQILDDYKNKPEPSGSEKTNGKPPKKAAEPKKKLPYERIKGIIDNAGFDIAQSEQLSLEEKIEKWVELLKWAHPLIPDDQQRFKSQVQQAIENPSEKDFIDRKRQRIKAPKYSEAE